MESEKLHIEGLIAGYFSQSLTEDESQELNTLLNESQENRVLFSSMRELWFAAGVATDDKSFDKDSAYRRFLIRAAGGGGEKRRRRIARIVIQSAAAAVLIVMASYVSFRRGNADVKNRFADITVEVPWGSRIKTSLPDGTSVWLNAGSAITYSQGFGVDERTVSLTGEGYFEVVPGKIQFGVRTEEICVNVIGTKFNFRNYPDDEEASVSLLEGKVSVCNRMKCDEKTVINPGQRVFLDKRNGEMRVKEANVMNTTEWTAGNLFFDEELLTDIIKELERHYNAKIVVADRELNSLRFYCSFIRREMSIKDIFDVLCSTGKMRYSINGKEIVLNLPAADADVQRNY